MKNDVDKRVVEFEFDNSKFDKNVKKSTKTLNQFEETLQFKDVSKSVDEIKIKFSALEVVMASVVRNITDRVANLGINLVKSLSIDNLAAGWQKFGEKTIAVGTLMSQTLKIAGRDIEDYSEKMGVVTDQLDKLNWFTDETSYNFTDMVDNIGKFTAAGQDLDKSVEAMMGIANWAALSGQNAATASRAMYQLSQALGKGYVQLIDYKSIQNANMDTQEFRKVVLETAVAMGELTKEGDSFMAKSGKKFTQNQFTEQLSAKWFTSDVLTASLKKYSGAVDKLYEITEKEGITASEAIERYSDQFDEFAIKAFKAAQEARTFSDAITSVKDAVSTGWMTTAEMIFGSYDEAKEFWTDLANELYDVFAESGNIRNEILAIWKSLEGRSDLFTRGGPNQGAFWNLYDSIIAVKNAFSEAWNTIFPKSEFEDEADQVNDIAHNLKTFTSNLQKATKRVKDFLENNDNLKRILQGAFSVVRVFVATLEALRYALDPIIYTLKELALVISDMFADLGDQISSSTGYANVLLEIAAKINKVLTNIFISLDLPGLLRKVTSLLGSIISIVKGLLSTIGNFIDSHFDFSKSLSSISSGLTGLTRVLKNFFSQFKRGSKSTKGSSVVNVITGEETADALENGSGEAARTLNILEVLKEFMVAILNVVKALYPLLLSIITLATSVVNTLASAIKKLTDKIYKLSDFTSGTFKALKKFLLVAAGIFIVFKIIDIIKNIAWMAEYIKGNIFATLDDLAYALGKMATAKTLEAIGYDLKALAISFLLIVAGCKFLEKVKPSAIFKGLAILAVLVAALVILVKTSKKLDHSFSLLNKNGGGLLSGRYKTTTLLEVGSVLMNLGIAFLLIAKSAKYFESVSTGTFFKVFSIINLLGTLMITMQIIEKRVKGGGEAIKGMLPSMFQLLGFALLFKSIVKTLVWAANVTATMSNKVLTKFRMISGIVAGLIVVLVMVNNLTKKATIAASAGRPIVIGFGLQLGFILMSIANVLFSAVLLTVVIKQAGSAATKALIWTASIISGIMILTIVLASVMNKAAVAMTLIGKESKFLDIFKRGSNPISSVLSSIAFMLTSLSIFLAVVTHIHITDETKKIINYVALFVGLLVIVTSLLQLIPNKNTLGNDEKSGVAAIVKSLSLLLIAIAVTIGFLSILPDQSAVAKIGSAIGVFVLAALGVLALISNQKSSVIKGSIACAIMVASLIGLAYAMKKFQSSVKADANAWKQYGYLVALMGLIVLIGVVVGAFPIIGGGIALFFVALGVGLAALGAGLWVLGWGIGKVGPGISEFADGLIKLGEALDKFTIDNIAALTTLFIELAGIEIVGILEKIFGGYGAMRDGLKDLAEGLMYLVDPLTNLTAEGATALGILLGSLASVEAAGILERLFKGYKGLKNGMQQLADGIYVLKDPIKELTKEGTERLAELLRALSNTSFRGLLSGIGNKFSGDALISIGKALPALTEGIKDLEYDHIDKLKALMNFLSYGTGSGWAAFGQGIAHWFGGSKSDDLKRSMGALANGLRPIIDALNELDDSTGKIQAAEKILNILNTMASRSGSFDAEKLEKIKNLFVGFIPMNLVSDLWSVFSALKSIVDLDISNEDFTIRPIIDLSNFESGYNKLTSMLTSLSGESASLSSELAYRASSSQYAGQEAVNVVNNNTSSNDTYTITINAESADPYEVAEEVDRILQQRHLGVRLSLGK